MDMGTSYGGGTPKACKLENTELPIQGCPLGKQVGGLWAASSSRWTWRNPRTFPSLSQAPSAACCLGFHARYPRRTRVFDGQQPRQTSRSHASDYDFSYRREIRSSLGAQTQFYILSKPRKTLWDHLAQWFLNFLKSRSYAHLLPKENSYKKPEYRTK